MDTLRFHQYHHRQLRISPLFMTPISLSSNLRAISTVSHCLPTIVSKYISTSLPKSCTSKSEKVKVINRVSADELKEKWLNSLTCPHLNSETENHIVDSKWVIGIDPDVSGALAVLKTDELGCSAQVYDSPSVKVPIGNRIRSRLDTKAMVQLIQSLNVPIGTTAFIEQSLPFPGDGKQGWWSGGFNNGLWIGTLVASGVSVVPVPSMRWKQEFKLSGNGKTKDDSRALACTLFPSLSSSLGRKKDHGRAEALLIAAYGKGIKLNVDSPFILESLTDTDTTT